MRRAEYDHDTEVESGHQLFRETRRVMLIANVLVFVIDFASSGDGTAAGDMSSVPASRC